MCSKHETNNRLPVEQGRLYNEMGMIKCLHICVTSLLQVEDEFSVIVGTVFVLVKCKECGE